MARFSRARLSAEEADLYGFRWGPMDVTRAAHLDGRGYVVFVTTDHLQVEVYVSEQGRRYQVIGNGPGKVKRRVDDAGAEAQDAPTGASPVIRKETSHD